jgi:hypothetical protein
LPSHIPFRPQLAVESALHSLSGSVFAVTAAHVPFAPPVFAVLHAWHVPLQAVLQQYPSTQLPLAHSEQPPATLQSLARLHAAPCAFFVEQVPVASQYVPVGQPASFAHPPGQLVLVPSHSAAPAHAGVPTVPAFTAPHVPSSVPLCFSEAAHASHVPLQVVSQHTPSTQLPDAHTAHPATLQSLVRLHVAPCAFFVAHVPALVQ